MAQSDAEVTPDSDQDVVPTLEQLAHHVQQLRSDERRWHVQRDASLRRLGDAVMALIDAQGHLKADVDRLADQLVLIRAAQGDQAEQLGRVLAELAARARQDSIHTEQIEATGRELAVARLRWLGWRGLAVTMALAVVEAIKLWLGGGGWN